MPKPNLKPKPIKFRMFDEYTLTMEDLSDCEIRFTKDGTAMTLNNESTLQTHSITQSTGKKDTQGVEIFEHDIVELMEKLYLVAWSDEYDGWYIWNRKGEYAHLGFVTIEESKVVGNRYENPLLFKFYFEEQQDD